MDQQLIREPGFRQDTYVYHKGDGYYYHFSSESFTTIYFVCASSSCNGRAKLCLGSALEQTQPHNHMPNVSQSQILNIRRNIVNQARALTYVSFSDIIHQERSRIADRNIRSLLTYRRLRPAMQRARSEIFPHVPSSLRELTIIHRDPAWAHLTKTTDNWDSIYLGSVDALDNSHSIIYCSQRSLQLLREVNIIFGDGTFYVTPSIDNCYQVFTIVSVFGHTVLPLVWCLMEKKSEEAYISVFVFLRHHLGNWSFDQVICDFEDAMINAFRRVFDISVLGCYFHFVNAVGKWALMNITHPILRDFPEVLNIVRYCSALPLLPRHLLLRGFNVIVEVALEMGLFLYVVCLPFLNYIENDWLNHANRGQTLSVCGSPHRTNNASESNNRRMNRRLQRAHPNIFHLISEFVHFEDETVDDFNTLRLGRIPTRHRATQSISNDEFIILITTQLMEAADPSDDNLLRFIQLASFSMKNVLISALGWDTM